MVEEIVRVVECPHCGKAKSVRCPDDRVVLNVLSCLLDQKIVPSPHRKVVEFCGKCGNVYSVGWFYSK